MRSRDKRVKLVWGSTSKKKLQYLKKALRKLGVKAKVSIYQVESGVGKQPMSKQETIQGAKHRAREALKQDGEAQVGVGIEGGLMEEEGILKMICVAAIVDSQGSVSWAESDKVVLPREVAEKVREGRQFGEVIREYFRDYKSEKVKELVSREKSFSEVLRQVLGDALSEGNV